MKKKTFPDTICFSECLLIPVGSAVVRAINSIGMGIAVKLQLMDQAIAGEGENPQVGFGFIDCIFLADGLAGGTLRRLFL